MDKYCCYCKRTLTTADFHKDRSRPDGLSHRCKSCAIEWARAHKRSKEKQFIYEMEYYYGMSVADYKAMEQEQGGKCAICGRRPEKRLAVDHCHDTDVVRGLLCRTCNSAIGLLQDDPDVIMRAAIYVEENKYGDRQGKRIIRVNGGRVRSRTRAKAAS